MTNYVALPGQLEKMIQHFQAKSHDLLEDSGVENIGYWVPVDNPHREVIHFRSFTDLDAKDLADQVSQPKIESAEGKRFSSEILDKSFHYLLSPLDFSKPFSEDRVRGSILEMRTYFASKGNLEALQARFRDHTLALFEKHGMTNLGYYEYAPEQEGGENVLLYFLAHKDIETAKKSWNAFKEDPAWQTAKAVSEEKAGGSLTAEGGVTSTFLRALDSSKPH